MLKTVLLLVLPAVCLAQVHVPSWSVIAHDFFNAADTDGNGEWTRNEIDEYFARFDENGNGRISHHEFTVALDHQAAYFIGHEDEWYAQFDVNNDNHLDHIDFNYAFYFYDSDHDGIVTLTEYENAVGLGNTTSAP